MTSFLPLRTFRRHAGAWLSLFAMLLVFAGPLVGQGMGQAHGTQADLSDICGDVPQGYIAGAALAAEGDSDPAPHHILLWEKCGYCSLLFQHPALADSHAALGYLGIRPIALPIPTFTAQQNVAPVFPGSRSRAPPQLRA
ncbi:DUF2946 domain-containing protein [Pseudomonas gingeri]|uniref:DUF2946 domain-containing protein n=1 Tax=Pseudomonas gingeri TaxID=117681 RepID=A0A7Y7YAE6_9PSED|nr:DUF2946 domain-containing protein [Pseudomonas gingeri]NWB26677.1 DUF2946 domain-containing protein [Pseudomonas gingeri]NWC32773.1 DUF2946 domain-containing protein [Pseudomonas gingeri]NWD07053.1 DUF2946 domain-containing protein [Pseudomonas gingeri]NWD52409.1 DUF2946 domain-containing protein [Pseudomonas gingeri]NWE31652.1 DUF2946 domain-containing protein [Pseudomonas gingeri]